MSGAQDRPVLPIQEILPQILHEVGRTPITVIHAPTGAGKTTALPLALLDTDLAEEGQIWVIEPRRIAARAAARFVARQRGVEPGQEVGWHVRFSPCFSSQTRLLYLTDGVAVRRLSDDPFLEGVAALIFDELHERALQTEVALAMARRVQREVRTDLRIVLMSATLDTARLAADLDGAEVISSEGRSFPVSIRFSGHPDTRHPTDQCAGGIRRALRETQGDILAFLPGVGEIHGTRDQLSGLDGLDVLPLYGALSPAEQDRALSSGPRRRIVLATNVAETSLTLHGIEAVVDTGLARIARHDPASGLDRLVVEPISQASADQRAGRAGRTGPGVAYRLWTERDHRQRPSFDEPAIMRSDLSGLILQFRAWGEQDLLSLPWLQPPPLQALESGEELLAQLGLLDETGLTSLGRAAADLPLHPRLAVLLLTGDRAGHGKAAALAAAILSGRDPFRRFEPDRDPLPATSTCDLLDRIDALRGEHDPRLIRSVAREVRKISDQLLRLLPRSRQGPTAAEGPAIRRALATAWADRIAQRRAPGSRRALLRSGRGVQLAESSAVREAALLTCIVIDDGPRREGRVRLASAVERDWLRSTHREVLSFDPSLRQVVAREQQTLDALILSEQPLPSPDPARAAPILLQAIRQDPRLLPVEEPEVESLLARLDFLASACPELDLPPPDPEWIDARLPEVLSNRVHLRDLDGASLAEALLDLLPWPQRRALDEEAPLNLLIPSGRRARITWRRGQRPVLAVRMQELFGLRETPRIARGRRPILLHLLAPNGRPAQITDDLQSFWAKTWTEVRKDLRARYPKHAWPDDPLSAAPSRGPKRRPR